MPLMLDDLVLAYHPCGLLSLAFVWTVTVATTRPVTVGTEHLKAWWEVVLLEPGVHVCSAGIFQSTSMRCSVSIHMVNVQELDTRFAAALAHIATVSCKYLILQLLVSLAPSYIIPLTTIRATTLPRYSYLRTVNAQTSVHLPRKMCLLTSLPRLSSLHQCSRIWIGCVKSNSPRRKACTASCLFRNTRGRLSEADVRVPLQSPPTYSCRGR